MSDHHIQWYPGHMAKARREAKEKLNLVDIVIELVDARLPLASRNPVIEEIIGNKKSLVVLNKADLADPAATQAWIHYFKQSGLEAIAIDAQHNKGIKKVQDYLKEMMSDYFQKQREKGVKDRPIRLMILGIPNVGKSTLINRFVGKNQAQTGNKPGVTKAQRWLKIGRDFELLDTPGILWPKFEDPQTGVKLAISGAIKDSLLYMDDLALSLLDHLQNHYPESISQRYKISSEEVEALSKVDLLLLITQKMGLKEDYDQASLRLINDFRSGKLGAISLELTDKDTEINE
ncbi:ribosome biogenesis GTPase YlqF [Hutsoniella sourekii]